MNIILIIILAIIITVIAGVNFKPSRNKAAIKKISSRRARSVKRFTQIYPGFQLFLRLIQLLAMIWVACLCAVTFHILAGSFIALVILALAMLLGDRLTGLIDQIFIERAAFFNHYFSWCQRFNSLVKNKADDPIEDIDELIDELHRSHIDCPTQIAIEQALAIRSTPIEKVATKWADVEKISYKDKLTPKRVDELYHSGQKIFPVIRNDEDDIVGLLHFADVSTVDQKQKNLLTSMKREFAVVASTDLVTDVITDMASNETTVAVVMKDKKVYGLVNLTDILNHQPKTCALKEESN